MERGKKHHCQLLFVFLQSLHPSHLFLEAGLYTGCVASWAQVEILSQFSGKSSESVYIILQGLGESLNHKRWWSAAGRIKASGPDLSSQAQTLFVWLCVCVFATVYLQVLLCNAAMHLYKCSVHARYHFLVPVWVLHICMWEVFDLFACFVSFPSVLKVIIHSNWMYFNPRSKPVYILERLCF